MLALFVVVAIVVLGVVAVLATGRGGGLGMGQVHDRAPWALPDEPTAADLAAVRFSVVARGYRMDEVDALLDRLGEELERRDGELARLRAEPEHRGGDSAGLRADPAGRADGAAMAPHPAREG